MTKAELIKLLEPYADDAEVVVAPVPRRNGWVQNIAPIIYKSGDPADNFDAVVLGLTEESAHHDELMLERQP